MLISQLPTWIQDYRDRFPNTISLVADAWERLPIEAISPDSTIEVFFADEREVPDYGLVRGKPFFNPMALPDNDERLVVVIVDGYTSFVQISDTVLLDKMQGLDFPDSVTRPFEFYNWLAKS
ncbi:hypothetical protein [Gloeothece verrucosa]|uniref:Uncharacterized protein n=1 Tax=Gloeothece verrucosa (strain PCC 7822) TaxID=497965 RepID=E0UMN2_GLOV7|nr:hypothetical protein [Gloeothece verrucosa]ADN18212.1 hypothetical protein Cyan7822_6428 [Gloeothece verrucosa PCC 7822]